MLWALCACLVAALAAAGLSQLIWGRSLQASVYELWLRRHFAATRTAEQEIERLEALRQAEEPRYQLPEKLTFQSDIRETDGEGMQVFTLNDGAESGTTVLYLHGGAYIHGFNAYQWRFMDRLAREARCRVVAPAYHLAPYADYRQAYADLEELYERLLSERPDDRVILMGDSAGGGLALGFAEALSAEDRLLPERLILFSPWVDVSMTNPDIEAFAAVDPVLHLELVTVHGRYWAGEADTRDWHVSPLYGDMSGLPPVTIYCGTREMLCPDILLAADRLSDAGIDVTLNVGRGLNHDYPLMPLPEAEQAVRDVISIVAGSDVAGFSVQ